MTMSHVVMLSKAYERKTMTNNILEECQDETTLKQQYFDTINRKDNTDNGWVDGIDICANCPNRPGSTNNKSGFCNCAIPSLYGPFRVTC